MSIIIFRIDRRYFIFVCASFDFSLLHEWSRHSCAPKFKTVVIHARERKIGGITIVVRYVLFYIGHILSIISLHFHPVFSFNVLRMKGRVSPQLGWPWQRSQRLKSILLIMRIINSRDYKKNARINVLECMYIVLHK